MNNMIYENDKNYSELSLSRARKIVITFYNYSYEIVSRSVISILLYITAKQIFLNIQYIQVYIYISYIHEFNK